MAQKPYAFTESAMRRTVDAVRKVERTPYHRGGGHMPGPLPAKTIMHAEIVAEDGETGNYSWKKLIPSDGVLIDDAPAIASDGFSARDLNGRSGIEPGTKVYLEFAGYDTAVEGEPARYLFNVDKEIVVGTLTAVQACVGTATATYAGTEYTIYLRFPQTTVPSTQQLFVGGEIAFAIISTDPPEGVALSPDVNNLQIMQDGEPTGISRCVSIDIHNEQGPDDRKDFRITPASGPDGCDNTRLELEWMGIDVGGYGVTGTYFKERRRVYFDGGNYSPESFACVIFSVSSLDAITSQVTGKVAMLKVDPSDENLLIEVTPADGGCVYSSPVLSHIGPGAAAGTAYNPVTSLVAGSSALELSQQDLPHDATGHALAPIAGATRSVPYVQGTIVALKNLTISCDEGVISWSATQETTSWDYVGLPPVQTSASVGSGI